MQRHRSKQAPSRGKRLTSTSLDVIGRTPAAYWNEVTGEAAWTAWYGSRETMLQLRKELLETGVRFEGFSRSQQKLMPCGEFLSMMLLHKGRQQALYESLGVARFSEIQPEKMLDEKIRSIIGEDTYNDIIFDTQTLPADELTEKIGSYLPQIAEMFYFGGFSKDIAHTALTLSALIEVAEQTQSNSKDGLTLAMVMHLVLNHIPVFLIRESLIASKSKLQSIYAIPGLFPEMDSFNGVDPLSPLLGSEPDLALEIAVDTLSSCSIYRWERKTEYADYYLETAQAHMLAAEHEDGPTRAVLAVCGKGKCYWEDALNLIGKMDLDAESKKRLDAFSKIVPPLFHGRVNQQVLTAARNYNDANYALLTSVFTQDEDEKLNSELIQIQSRIAELATALSPSAYLELGQLSEQATRLTEAIRMLAVSRLDHMDVFLEDMEYFREDAGLNANTPMLPVERLDSDETSHSETAAHSEMELELLEANSRLEAELKGAKAENRRLKILANQLQARPNAPGTADAELVDLANRRARSQPLTPEQILRYYQLIAGDRLEVLDSAWQSSRVSEHFKEPDRLFEMLGKLVFEYLDGVRNGEPMGALGIQLFAGGFAAKESQTVQRDVRMRAQREFSYRGQNRFFEYRLRIANGWGSVEGMRLYFDVIDCRLVIAYVGEHLDQAGTN